MKILHTSDWHIGKNLYNEKRYIEFEKFFQWLTDVINKEKIDVLLVCGDVFDTGTPSNKAQSLYFKFLADLSGTCCRKVIITGGNHDSPSLLEASKKLLESLNIDVIGAITDNIEDEIIIVEGSQNNFSLIVGAVPYLRDKDIRKVQDYESIEDKDNKLKRKILEHYCELSQKIKNILCENQTKIPVIITGHLFAAGGKTYDGDGVRELYVGTATHVGADVFCGEYDYVALGHLHTAQKVFGKENIRYSGSPLQMSFDESHTQKKVIIVDIENKTDIRELCVPVFQKLKKISGNMEVIEKELNDLIPGNEKIWIEVNYTGEDIVADLNSKIEDIAINSELKILRVRNQRIYNEIMSLDNDNLTLDDISVEEVFENCLETNNIPDNQKIILKDMFSDVLRIVMENDEEQNPDGDAS